MAADAVSTGFLVRLSADEREALRRQAEHEQRSMQEVARAAILERITETTQRERALDVLGRVLQRDAELLDRLSR